VGGLPNACTLLTSSRIRSRTPRRISFQILSFLPRHLFQNAASEPPLHHLTIAQSKPARRSMAHPILDTQAFLAALSLGCSSRQQSTSPRPFRQSQVPLYKLRDWKIAMAMAYAAFGWIAQEQVQRTPLGSVHNTPRYLRDAASYSYLPDVV
jgi:hypothetical protein